MKIVATSRERSNRNLDQTTHGHSQRANMHPLHRVWREMRQRCTNPNSNRYANYGGRGISVCARWDSFEAFLADMGLRPAGVGPGGRSLYSLDRIDNDGDYEPSNCRWATTREQSRNMSRNRQMTCDGVTRLLCEWAEHLGVSKSGIHYRLRQGMSDQEVLSVPFDRNVRRRRR